MSTLTNTSVENQVGCHQKGCDSYLHTLAVMYIMSRFEEAVNTVHALMAKWRNLIQASCHQQRTPLKPLI